MRSRERPQEIRELRKATPNNERLERIFAAAPEFINREYTLPCTVGDALYLDPVVEANGLFPTLREHCRTIVTPKTISEHPDLAERHDMRVLSSPHECGRVLEADEPVLIDGEQHILTIKGVGATTYMRGIGLRPQYSRSLGIPAADERQLQSIPFAHKIGVLGRKAIEAESATSTAWRKRGIACERILAIFPLREVVNEAGELQSIASLQARGVIDADEEPVIAMRASKENLRLMDFIESAKQADGANVQAFARHILQRFQKETQRPEASLTDYALWLCDRVLSQELPLILEGTPMSSGFWPDLGRNISILGEELDLEDAAEDEIPMSEMGYIDEAVRHIDCVYSVLMYSVDLLGSCAGRPMPFDVIGDTVIEKLRASFAAHDFGKTWRSIPSQRRRSRNPQELRSDVTMSIAEKPFRGIRSMPLNSTSGFSRFERSFRERVQRALINRS